MFFTYQLNKNEKQMLAPNQWLYCQMDTNIMLMYALFGEKTEGEYTNILTVVSLGGRTIKWF